MVGVLWLSRRPTRWCSRLGRGVLPFTGLALPYTGLLMASQWPSTGFQMVFNWLLTGLSITSQLHFAGLPLMFCRPLTGLSPASHRPLTPVPCRRRDLFPEGRRVYELQQQYELEMAEPAEVTARVNLPGNALH